MNKKGTVWDVLIITAADKFQATIFEEQIHLNAKLFEYFEYYFVETDACPGIGSGFATVDAINALVKNAFTMTPALKVLLIHSGGYSSRLPHASPFGKLFALMTDGKTVLEHKLEAYKNLPKHLPSGIFVAASDTIETVSDIPDQAFADMSPYFVMFGHYSSEEVARNHGVLIPGDKIGSRLTISKILQKPSSEILLQEEAAQNDGKFITDSCYFMNYEVAKGLVDLVAKTRETLSNADLCCYADFMRPIGVNANDTYVEDTIDPILRKWRRLLFDYFNSLTGKETLIVHESSKFYHFGTVPEFLSHITEGGAFWKPGNKNAVHCDIEYGVTVPSNSYIEFSRVYSKCTIGQNSLISGLDLRNIGADRFEIPSNCLIICWPLLTGNYVTIYMPTSTDIKKDFPEGIQWFNVHLPEYRNFYNAQIFPLGESPNQSLLRTMDYAQRGIIVGFTLISLREAIGQIDRNRMRKDRFILYSMD